MGGLNAHEVGFVDDSRGSNGNLAGVQRVADRGDMGVVASVHLRGGVGPGHVLNATGSIDHRQSGGGVNNTTVPAERSVFNIHTDEARSVHWVDPHIWAADHMETGTGGTAVNVSVNGHDVGVFCVNSVFAACE